MTRRVSMVVFGASVVAMLAQAGENGFVVRSASYRCRVAGGSLSVDAEYRIEVDWGDVPVEVPLVAGRIGVRGRQLPASAFLACRSNTVYAVLGTPGVSKVALRFDVAVDREGRSARAGFTAGAGIVRSIVVTTDDKGADRTGVAGIPMRKGAQGIEGFLDRDEVVLHWIPAAGRGEAGERPADPVTFCRGEHVARYRQDVLEVESAFNLDIEAPGIHGAVLQLPPGMVPAEVVGHGIRDWTLTPESDLRVDLAERTKGAYVLRLRGVVALPELPGEHLLALPRLETLALRSDVLRIAEEGVRADILEVESMHRTDVNGVVEDGDTHFQNVSNAVAAFIVWGQTNARVRVALTPLAPQIRVNVATRASVSADRTRLNHDMTVTVSERPLREVEVTRHPFGQLVSVLGSNVASWRTTSRDADSETVRVRFAEPVLGDTSLSMCAHMDYDRVPAKLCLSGVRFPGALSARGRVHVSVGEGVMLRDAVTAGLTALPAAMAAAASETNGVSESRAFIQQTEGWRLELDLAVRSPKLSVETFTVLESQPDALHGSVLCHYLVEHAPLGELTIELPAEWRNVAVKDAAAARVDVEGTLARVTLGSEVKGTGALNLSFEVPADGTGTLFNTSGSVFREAVSQQGVVAMVAGGEFALKERSRKGLVTMAPDAVPLRYSLLLDRDAALAYRHRSAAWSLAVDVSRRRVATTPDILVESAHIRSWVSPGERTVTRATYTVRNHGRDYVRVRLPCGVDLLGAFVDGREAVPHLDGESILLRLPRHGVERSFGVDIRCIGKQRCAGQRWTSSFATRVYGPVLDVPIVAAAWEVRPRSAMRLIKCEGTSGLLLTGNAADRETIGQMSLRLPATAWYGIAALAVCAGVVVACGSRFSRLPWPVFAMVLLGLAIAAGHLSETARRTDVRLQCNSNMRRIEDAIDEVMSLSNYVSCASVSTEQIRQHMKNGELPRCPDGGTYSGGSETKPVRCTVHGDTVRGPGAAATQVSTSSADVPPSHWTLAGVVLPAGVSPWVNVHAVDPVRTRSLFLMLALALLLAGSVLASVKRAGRAGRIAAAAVSVVALVLLAARFNAFGRFTAGIPLVAAAGFFAVARLVRFGAVPARRVGAASLLLFASLPLAASHAVQPVPSDSHGGIVVQEVCLDVLVTGETAVVDARIDAVAPLRAGRKGNHLSCPLLPVSTAIETVEVASPDGIGRVVRSGGNLTLRGQTPGTYRVCMRYLVPVRQEANIARVVLPLPSAPLRIVRVRVDRENLVVRSPGAVSLDTHVRKGKTLATVIPGAGEWVALEFMDALRERERPPMRVETESTVSVSTAGVLLQSTLVYRSAWGGVDQARVLLPRGLEVIRVGGEHIARQRTAAVTNGTVVTAELKRSTHDAAQIELLCHSPAPALPYQSRLLHPVPLDVSRATGRLTVSAQPGIALEFLAGAGLRRVSDGIGDGCGDARETHAFAISRPEVAMDYSATRAAPRVQVRMNGLVRVQDDAVELAMTCVNEICGAGVSELLAELPGEAELMHAEADHGARCFVREQDGQRRLVVRQGRTRLGRLTYSLVLRWPRSAARAESVTVSPVRPVAVESCLGMLGVQLAEGELGLYRKARGLVPCPVDGFGDASANVAKAFRFSTAEWTLEMEVAHPRPWVEASAAHHVRVGTEELQVVSQFRYAVRRGAVAQLDIVFPPEAGDVRLLSGEARLKSVTNGVHRLAWKEELSGERNVRFGYTLPVSGETETMALECPRTVGIDREAGYVAVSVADERDILSLCKPLEPGVRECPGPPALGNDMDRLFAGAALCCRYSRRPARLVVNRRRHEQAPVTICRVTEADAISVLSSAGRLLTRAVYDVVGRGERFLVAELPPGSRLLSCFVADEPVQASMEDRRIAVPLGDLKAGQSARRVRLTYTSMPMNRRTAESSGRVSEKLRLVMAQLYVPVEKLQWTLFLPEGRDYRHVGGSLPNVTLEGRVALQRDTSQMAWGANSAVRAGMASRLANTAGAAMSRGNVREAHGLYRRAAAATESVRDTRALTAFNDLVDTVAACLPPLPPHDDAFGEALALAAARVKSASQRGSVRTREANAPPTLAARRRFRNGIYSLAAEGAPQFRFALPASGLRYVGEAAYVLPDDGPASIEFNVTTVTQQGWRQTTVWCALAAALVLLVVGLRRRLRIPTLLGLLLLTVAYASFAVWL